MKSLFILILILAVRGPAHANPSDTSAAHADLLRAFELLENQPMTLAKAHALIAAVSLRHELHPGATNAIGDLDPILDYFRRGRQGNATSTYPGQLYPKDVADLACLYARLDSPELAERSMAFLENPSQKERPLEALARAAVIGKRLPEFERYFNELRESIGSEDSFVGTQYFINIAECLATNDFRSRAREVFVQAQERAGFSWSPFWRFGNRNTLADASGGYRHFMELGAISSAMHRHGFTRDARRIHKYLKSFSPKGEDASLDLPCDRALFDLTLALGDLRTARRMADQFPPEHKFDLDQDLADAEARAGKIDDALERLKTYRDLDWQFAVAKIARSFAEAHEFEKAEWFREQLTLDHARNIAAASIGRNLARVGRRDEAFDYLAQNYGDDNSEELRVELSHVRPSPPVPLLPRPFNGPAVCPVSALEPYFFRKHIETQPEQIIALMQPHPINGRIRAPRYTCMRAVGRTLGYYQLGEETIDAWKSRFPDAMSVAFLHLGIAEARRAEYLNFEF